MKVLITGLHRSGTSATAKLLAYCTQLSLLDDPEWAIFDSRMAAAYRCVPAYRAELETFDIVKCPRLAECLQQVLVDFPASNVIFLVRDPRDVYCSIVEAQLSDHSSVSTMLENKRFGQYAEPWEGVGLSFTAYAERALEAVKHSNGRVRILMYDELFRAPVQVVEGIMSLLSLCKVRPIPRGFEVSQLGPLRNKHPADMSIKGPSRWKRDLKEDIANSIWEQCSTAYESLLQFATQFSTLTVGQSADL